MAVEIHGASSYIYRIDRINSRDRNETARVFGPRWPVLIVSRANVIILIRIASERISIPFPQTKRKLQFILPLSPPRFFSLNFTEESIQKKG